MSRIFLTPENSITHQKWRWYYEQPLGSLLANREIVIPYSDVLKGDSTTIFERIATLQHYPALYQHMMFSISLKFLKPEGDGYFTLEEIGASMPMLIFFDQLSYFPAFYFFWGNDVLRSFTRLGLHLMAYQHLNTTVNNKGAFNIKVSYTRKQMELILKRVITSCRQLQLYFHDSGKNPDEYIVRGIEEDQLPLTLSDIKAYLEEDLKSNKNNVYR